MQSRVEDILQAMIDGTESSELPKPQSRNEDLLLQVLDKMNEGSGGAVIDDTTVSTTKTWSSSKIDSTKLDANQGGANLGKVMGVAATGDVVPVEVEGGNIAVTETPVSGDDYAIDIVEGEHGNVTSVAGKTGVVTLNGDDVLYSDLVDYGDGTVGGEIANLKSQMTDVETLQRVSSLNTTHFAKGTSIEAVGIPVYVDDVTDYPQYDLTETGWYIFARVTAKDSVTVSASTVVNGAAGYIAVVGNSYIDLAVKFGVAAMTQEVVINWGAYTDTLLFKATDLALRNMDYRTTYVEYDIGEYLTWTYALTTDTTFQRYRQYFILDNGEYTKADVIYGDPVPADTYYVHTLAHFEGMPRNITFMSAEIIDCPVEIVLPEIPEDGYGAWFEFRLRYDRQCSCTLIPPSDEVHITTDNLANHTAGINILDLHYSFTGGNKSWSLISTHRGLNEYRHLVGLEFMEPPTKNTYVAGETLDLTGAKVVATFSDGSRHNVTVSENNAGSTRVTTYSPANGAALTTANTEVTCTFKYMEGHTVLEKTLTCTTPLTVTEG